MVSQLKVLHCNRKSLKGVTNPWFRWETCLRQIIIGHSQWSLESLPDSVDVYEAEEAYQFLVEVGCGLQSPMLGETEVFGQYKKFLSQIQSVATDQNKWLVDLLDNIRLDIKKIRNQYLVGLGSQSYGSLVRKKTKSASGISFIGSGQLVQEILPWVAKHPGHINVYCRHPEKYQQFAEQFQFAEWLNINSLENRCLLQEVVVICAPMTAVEIGSLLTNSNVELLTVIDLRGESSSDPISDVYRVESLEQLLSQIKNNRMQADQKVSQARGFIVQLFNNNSVYG
ncbi:MAG: hypothetical protein R2827_06575 [Bdellovibrionales bacterium]